MGFLFVFLSIFILVSKLSYSAHGAGIANLPVRSVDTMKFSRDTARKEAKNEMFDMVIEKQISNITSLNVTHVAIDTPYDEEFVPFLKRWVRMARKYKLKVWFRGNLSGWEGWFEYPRIDTSTRINSLEKFIRQNKDLFQDGDIFTSCPECENGSIDAYDDPQRYKKFLIDEYQAIKQTFEEINIKVISNYNSMNGDIAQLVMDENTTKAMDGIVTLDHYVHSHEKFINDINNLAANSGGRIVLGEVGAPIPDIHGEMNELEQREWVAILFAKLNTLDKLEGINYWVSYGGSSALWNADGKERLVVEVIRNAYGGRKLRAKLVDRNGKDITDAEVKSLGEVYMVDSQGIFVLPYLYEGQVVEISAKGYAKMTKVILKGKPGEEIVLDFEVKNLSFINNLWDRVWKGLTYPFRALFTLLTDRQN